MKTTTWDNLPAEIRRLSWQEWWGTLAHTTNGDKKGATGLHLQSTGSDRDWGEPPKTQKLSRMRYKHQYVYCKNTEASY